MAKRSILIVGPHPDDETLGCGGTLARRVQEGCRVAVVVVTDGRNLFRLSRWKIEVDPTPDEVSRMRKEETRRAVSILGGGGQAVRFLDVEDASLAEHVEAASEAIAAVIREASPDEIYVTNEYEAHPDHVAACQVVRSAMRTTQSRARLYRYIISLRRGLSPSSIPEARAAMDIAAQLETKRRAVGQFASHLTIVGRGQTEPFFHDVEEWLQPHEVFFVDCE